MGSYDGVKTCELVGSFLLSQLQDLHVNKGLYRDDGLAISNASLRHTESIKKHICHVFNQNGLCITIEANKQIINFLDITFNLNNNTYQPFTKHNTTLQYIHCESNHHKENTCQHQQTTIISHQTKHHSTKLPLHTKNHLMKADTTTLYTTNRQLTARRKNRQRNNILWYNPPFSKNVNTNICHRFLTLVDKHFPKDHKLRKIFNRNTIKISYSCITETAFNHQLSIKELSNVTTLTLQKHTQVLQKTTSRQDTETTLHHSITQSIGTLPNSANIFRP